MKGSPPLVAIVGPTASGKSGLAIDVARRVEAEIISMDSRQLYRGMDIGTAKATPEQRAAVPHHGLDLLDPDERFSAGRFAQYARGKIDEIRARGHIPLLVGGTGFFLRALTHPIFQEPSLDPRRRERLAKVLSAMEDAELHRWLAALDPESAERLQSWGGRQRVMRALEMPLLTGRTLPWWHKNSPPRDEPLRPLTFVLEMPRGVLYASIDRRVDEMMRSGLVDEVRALTESGYGEHSPGMNATGYIELLAYLKGEAELDEALELIRNNTRAYARRQITWLRRQLPEGSIPLDMTKPRDQLAEKVVHEIRSLTVDRPEEPAS